MAFLPPANTHPLCYWQFCFITVNLENKILPIVHLILNLTKTHILFYTFCQKHSGCIFASGKNGSTPGHDVYDCACLYVLNDLVNP